MAEPSAPATLAPYFGMAAAALGFAGVLVILIATWGTIGLRKTIIQAAR